jgi:hypothetical protein
MANTSSTVDFTNAFKGTRNYENSQIHYYLKRPSEHVGIGNSSLSKLRSSRDQSPLNNLSHIQPVLNNNHTY